MARHFAPADQFLLQRHKLHRSAYVRVARKLGIHPSYVSLVAAGGRQNEKVMRALLPDLYRIDRLTLPSAVETPFWLLNCPERKRMMGLVRGELEYAMPASCSTPLLIVSVS